jgi:hypothetical protein
MLKGIEMSPLEEATFFILIFNVYCNKNANKFNEKVELDILSIEVTS